VPRLPHPVLNGLLVCDSAARDESRSCTHAAPDARELPDFAPTLLLRLAESGTLGHAPTRWGRRRAALEVPSISSWSWRKRPRDAAKVMVRLAGVEPATLGLEVLGPAPP